MPALPSVDIRCTAGRPGTLAGKLVRRNRELLQRPQHSTDYVVCVLILNLSTLYSVLSHSPTLGFLVTVTNELRWVLTSLPVKPFGHR